MAVQSLQTVFILILCFSTLAIADPYGQAGQQESHDSGPSSSNVESEVEQIVGEITTVASVGFEIRVKSFDSGQEFLDILERTDLDVMLYDGIDKKLHQRIYDTKSRALDPEVTYRIIRKLLQLYEKDGAKLRSQEEAYLFDKREKNLEKLASVYDWTIESCRNLKLQAYQELYAKFSIYPSLIAYVYQREENTIYECSKSFNVDKVWNSLKDSKNLISLYNLSYKDVNHQGSKIEFSNLVAGIVDYMVKANPRLPEMWDLKDRHKAFAAAYSDILGSIVKDADVKLRQESEIHSRFIKNGRFKAKLTHDELDKLIMMEFASAIMSDFQGLVGPAYEYFKLNYRDINFMQRTAKHFKRPFANSAMQLLDEQQMTHE